jgi:threonine/homoserine/homoserine lactone efflux protein
VHELLAFVGVSVVVIVTPGPDTALTVRNTLVGGRRAGLQTATGVISGQVVWSIATAAGVAALLVASEPVFRALRYAGAAYLIWLGLQSLIAAARGSSESHEAHERRGSPLRQGLINDLANPKMAVFFTSLLPQFATSFFGIVAFGALFGAMTFAWLALYAAAIARAGDALKGTRLRRGLDALMGTVLVALGLRVATDMRR